jgi:CheY-like chemotaxis protein
MTKVLLIEDDLQLCIMLKLLLQAEKLDVQVCNSGLEAQKALDSEYYDVIVLDWDLPDLSGPAICRLYRQRGGRAPILLLVAKPDSLSKEAGFDASADDYLAKPFNPHDLLARLNDLLRRSPKPIIPSQKTIVPNEPQHPEIALALHMLGNRYDEIKQIGKGAMGLVFKATDKTLSRPVALKLLHPDFLPNAQSLTRFKQEAQNIARLLHPNIVTIYDFGVSTNGVPYLVMEYLNGSPLDDILMREHQIHPKQALKIFKQVCDSLVHAHGKGIIHRDIKPGNMMFQQIDPNLYVIKLLDFGISKWLQQPSNQAPNLTKSGEIFGSPVYMSPEQSLGLPVDHRSDIFSIGYVFYECVTGIKLFLGDNDLDTMHRRTVEQPLPFAVVRPDLNLPQSLESVIVKALAMQPKDRYQTAAELKWALDAISGSAGGSILA